MFRAHPSDRRSVLVCDGKRTVAEIVEELHGRYPRVVEDEVRRFLARIIAKRSVGISDGR